MKLGWGRLTLLSLVCIAIGAGIGWYAHQTSPALYKGGVLYQSNAPFKYVDPLLACDIGSEEAFPEFAPLKAQLQTLIDKKIAAGDAQKVSVYIRSLRSARWFDLNETTTYAPASLLKVFVMMAYYKEADDTDNPNLLNKRIVFESTPKGSVDDPGEIIPHLVAGNTYTVEQVIDQMIIYSDNDALNTLVDNFDTQTYEAFQGVFSDLGIPSPVTQNENSLNFMTVDNYAMIFRVLFGSTYLSNRYSEQALALLSRAHYTGGLVAGVPSGLSVAHKFGVTTVPGTATTSTANELHDCGIVYHANNHPYLVCVMTEGQNFAQLQETIKEISATSYSWLDTFYANLPNTTASTTQTVRP